jgi:hypothetical protein
MTPRIGKAGEMYWIMMRSVSEDLDTLERQQEVLKLQAIARELLAMWDDEVAFGFAELRDERMTFRELEEKTGVPKSNISQSVDRVRPDLRTARKGRAPKQRDDANEPAGV